VIANIDVAGQHAQDLRQCSSSFPFAEDQCNVLVSLTVEDMRVFSIIPFVVERPTDGMMTRASWTDLQKLLDDVTLQSSTFNSWPALLQQNLRFSINNSVCSDAFFLPFIVNALLIQSTKSRHKTHIIMINMSMGHGLGEIKIIDSYSVKTVAEISSSMEQEGLMSAELRQLLDLFAIPKAVSEQLLATNPLLL
jgi:hypothetical protein